MSMLGKHHSEETKLKMSLSGRGKHNHYGQNNPNFGKIASKEKRERMSAALRGKFLGEKNPNFGNGGEKAPMWGRKLSREARKKIGEVHSKEKCHFWKGGISFEPYCPLFNREFKERVRKFFGYQCVECESPQNGRKLCVHHVNFNKESCCDKTIPLFVPLCHSCHSKTNGKRNYWEQHFTKIINEQYGGQCYLPKVAA